MYQLFWYDEDQQRYITEDKEKYATKQCCHDIIYTLARVFGSSVTVSVYGGISYYTGKSGRFAVKHIDNSNMPR